MGLIVLCRYLILVEMTAAPHYKEPILTLIFRLLGMLFGILAGLAFIAGIVMVATGHGSLEAVMLQVFPAFVLTTISAIIYLGLGQVIDFLGKTAHATASISQSQAAMLASINDRLAAIQNRLEQGQPFKVKQIESGVGSVANPDDLIYFYLNSESVQEGPVSQNDLISFLETGLIGRETLVLRDGEDEWIPCYIHVK